MASYLAMYLIPLMQLQLFKLYPCLFATGRIHGKRCVRCAFAELVLGP